MITNPYQWYMEVTLMALNGPFKDSVYSIDETKEFVFGRGSECTVAVSDDETVSPVHFRIEVETPVVWLSDCSIISGVFIKHYLLRWRHFRGPSNRTDNMTPSCRNAFLLHDNDLIRVGDYLFLLKIDIPSVCIECGQRLSRLQRAMSEMVGDIYYCVECKCFELDKLEEDEDFIDPIELIKPFLDKRYDDISIEYLLGVKARDIWLKGIHNNKEYVKNIFDYSAILNDHKKQGDN